MRLLEILDQKYLLGIDIETVRIKENFEDLTEEYKEAWQYKLKQAGEIPTNEELSDKWTKVASLYAEFSKVCAVSVSYLDKSSKNLICKEFFGKDETEILKDTKDLLDLVFLKDRNYRLIGHAAKYFDYPFLCKRYMINSMGLPKILDTAHLKPWENKNICTNMDIWKMGGTGPGSSLQALCTCLGLPISKADLVGDEVGKAYYEGEFDKIGRYCSHDAVSVFNIFLRLKGLDIFEFEEVKYI